MKRIFTLLLLFSINSLFAQNFEVDGIAYNITSSSSPYTVEVTSKNPIYTNSINIPEQVIYNNTTYSVTGIRSNAFVYCSLTSITIPNSVTSIASNAFSNCKGLDSIEVISNNQNYTSINGILYNKDITTLLRCPQNKTSVVIPNSVTSIVSYAFSNCTGLTSITIPDSVTSIGNSAFYECTGLTSITIPNSVTSIEESAFYKCTGLTSISIPNSVTSIRSSTFEYCTGLTSISIPNSITSIESSAFEDCTGLTSISIPNSVTSIRSNAFLNCTGLTSIDVMSNNPSYSSINGILYNKNITTLIQCPKNKTSVVIPNSVTNIESYAFYKCSGLTSISIPNSVTSIKSFAFESCTGLTSIAIPNSVTKIDIYAFYYCIGLTSITIPNSVTSIGWDAFADCIGLTSITIPNSVISIGSDAFYGCTGLTSITISNSVTSIGYYAFRNCTGLTSITCFATIPPILEILCFENVSKTIPLYVPYQSVELYKVAEQWKDFDIKGIIPVIGTGKNTVTGHIYLDENANGKKDTLELGLPNQKILILPDSVYTLSNNDGDFTFKADTGCYKINIVLQDNWQLSSDSSSYNVNITSDTNGFDFGIKGINNVTNIETSISSNGSGRCFATVPYYLTFENKGTQISNGVLTFKPDKKLLNFSQALPIPDSIASDTSSIFWNYTNLKPGEYRQIKLNIRMPNFNTMGDTLVSTATINNGLSFNYTDTLKQFVRCSYDPNEKIVYPAGVQKENYILKNEPLIYTIYFQNTGNDTAYQVVIIDTLDTSFVLNTFEVLASSHNVKTTYTTKGKVEFMFANIMLVDSITNEPKSHGFVKYSISPKTDLRENTIVSNKAYIFFDFNTAIITNETKNTYVSKIPDSNTSIENKAIEKEKSLIIYPNPAKQSMTVSFVNTSNVSRIEIINTLGQSVYVKQINISNKTEQLDISTLQQGVYFIKVHTDNGNVIGKMVKE